MDLRSQAIKLAFNPYDFENPANSWYAIPEFWTQLRQIQQQLERIYERNPQGPDPRLTWQIVPPGELKIEAADPFSDNLHRVTLYLEPDEGELLVKDVKPSHSGLGLGLGQIITHDELIIYLKNMIRIWTLKGN